MTDQASFLAAIAAEPGDDTPRLAFADYLDEQEPVRSPCPKCGGKGETRGDGIFATYGKPCLSCGGAVLPPHSHRKGTGSVIDSSNADRAEFIRHQIEWDRLKGISQPNTDAGHTETWRVLGVGERAKALLATYKAAWLAGPKCENPQCIRGRHVEKKGKHGISWVCPICDGTGDAGGLLREFEYRSPPNYAGQQYVTASTTPVRVGFARGFPDRVEVPRLADVVEHFDVITAPFESHPEYRPTPWALSVVRHHPVTRFVPLCRKPFPDNSLTLGTSRTFDWFSQPVHGIVSDRSERAVIPAPVFDLMASARPRNVTPATGGGKAIENPTRKAAVDALAVALGQFIRGCTHTSPQETSQ